MFGQRGILRWSEVRKVRFASVMKWFVLELHSGTTVRVSAMLIGLPEFARLLLRYVPKEAIDPEAHALLLETTQGRPLTSGVNLPTYVSLSFPRRRIVYEVVACRPRMVGRTDQRPKTLVARRARRKSWARKQRSRTSWPACVVRS
jgi:hypothetical protein